MENRYYVTLWSLICFTSPATALNDELINDSSVAESSYSLQHTFTYTVQVPAGMHTDSVGLSLCQNMPNICQTHMLKSRTCQLSAIDKDSIDNEGELKKEKEN